MQLIVADRTEIQREQASVVDGVVDQGVDQGIKAKTIQNEDDPGPDSPFAVQCRSKPKQKISLDQQLLEVVKNATQNLSQDHEKQRDVLVEIEKLLRHEANPNIRDSQGKTCLHYAASAQSEGDGLLATEIVDLLLSFDAWPDAVDHQGLTPLLLATRTNHAKIPLIVENLIDSGAYERKRDPRGWTSLHYAAFLGKPEVVKILLSTQALPNAVRKGGHTPLLDVMSSEKISQEERLGVAKLLISAKANVNAANKAGETSLHLACERGDGETVKLLLSYGASLTAVDEDGENALLIAAKFGNLEMVKLLIDAGADVNFINEKAVKEKLDSITALHIAVNNVNLKMLQLLLDHGADPNCANKIRHSLLISALYATYDPSRAMLKLLLSHGADMYDGSPGCWSAVDEILLTNGVTEMQILVQNGFDIEIYKNRSDKERFPLHDACGFNGSGDLLSLLLDLYSAKGILNIEQEDDQGRTPLIIAVQSSSPECIRLLLRAGADVNHVWRNYTPLELIVCGDCGSIFTSFLMLEGVQLLVERGAKIENLFIKILSDARSCGIEDWNYEDDGNSLNKLRSSHLLEKAKCVIKYRVLYESRNSSVKKPIEKNDMGGSAELKKYYEVCKAEIVLMKKSRVNNPISYYDTLSADEDFSKRVRDELLVYRSLDKSILQNRFPVYGEDLYKSLKDLGYLQNLGGKSEE